MRIVWTQSEKDQVFEAMIQAAVNRPHLPSKDLMREGQQVLPQHRKTVINDQRVFNYKKMIEGARDAASKIRTAKANQPEEPVIPVIEPELRKEQSLSDQLNGLLDMIADKVADRVMERVQQQLRVEIVTDSPKPEAVPLPQGGWLDDLMALSIRKQPKQRKTSCLIVGLNGAQIETIQHHAPHIDFTFVTGEQALSHHTFNKDHTILMTKFINHGVHNKYRKHPNMHYCNGGVSELKYLLNGLFKLVTQ